MSMAKGPLSEVKPEKIETVAAIKQTYASTAAKGGSLVFAEYSGLKVEDLFKLRKSLREKSVRLQVLKNTLVRRALEESGVTGASDYLKGPIAVAFSPDEVSASKVMTQFAKEMDDLKIQSRKLVIKGGAYAGKVLDANGVKALAAIPSREVLIAQVAGLLKSPIQRLAGVLAAAAAVKFCVRVEGVI